jgi:hypothetical protein
MRSSVLILLGLSMAVVGVLMRQSQQQPEPPRPIRSAGPKEMRDPPSRWSIVDEMADESFPASDPPSTY